MKFLLVPALLMSGAAASAASAESALFASEPATRICALSQQRRDGSRRICLTPSQWQARLGPDWRQVLTGRNAEDDVATLAPRTRLRAERRPDCLTCPRREPLRTD
jgi:hypothetical protein